MNTEQGIKYDNGKPRLGEMIKDFSEPLKEICKVWSFGADKYSKGNWKLVENAEDRYTNALIRHLVAENTEGYDKESKILHAAHVAWNAIARLHFIIKSKRENENQ